MFFLVTHLLVLFFSIEELKEAEQPCRLSCDASAAPRTYSSREESVERSPDEGILGLSQHYGMKRPPEVGTTQVYLKLAYQFSMISPLAVAYFLSLVSICFVPSVED